MSAPPSPEERINIRSTAELLESSLKANAASNWGRAAVNLGLLIVAIAYAMAYFLAQGCGS